MTGQQQQHGEINSKQPFSIHDILTFAIVGNKFNHLLNISRILWSVQVLPKVYILFCPLNKMTIIICRESGDWILIAIYIHTISLWVAGWSGPFFNNLTVAHSLTYLCLWDEHLWLLLEITIHHYHYSSEECRVEN